MRTLLVSTVVAALALSGACGPASERAPSSRPVVVATIEPLAWFVERIAGDAVETIVLVPAGASPELAEPGVRERRALERAAVVVAVGHPAFLFETTWVDPLLAERDGVVVVRVGSDGSRGAGDPHVWLTPRAGIDLVERMTPELARLLPDRAGEIEERAASLVEEARALDAEIESLLAPYRGRRFFVFHPAWGAFAERYGLVQEAAEEHGAEPGPQHLAELVDLARRERATTVFVQPQFAERGVRSLAAEIGADVEVLDPLARDWDANLRRAAESLARSFAREDGAAM